MELKALSINGLVAKKPIIQGGMGIGISLSRLAGAVASEGGVGVISAAHPGYSWKGFSENPLKTNLEALAYHINAAKENALGGVIGVNIMCVSKDYVEFVKCCIENKADLIISGAGLPITLPEIIKNSAIRIAPIISSIKAAKVLLKLWDRRYGKTADMVVVEGPKAGGHLGFSPDELERASDNFDEEVTGIIEYVKEYEEKYQRKIPVVFGGGVYDRKDINYYLELGCSGVQMATRFAATKECDAHENFKKAYINAREEDITIVKSPVGMPGRAINNDFVKRTLSEERIPIKKCYSCMSVCDPKTTPYCISNALINSVVGNTNDGLIFCGTNASRTDRITTVKELMTELCTEV